MTAPRPVTAGEVDAVQATCTKCKETKPAEAFPRDPRKRSGLSSWCRACGALANAAYYSAHRAEYAAQKARYRAEHKAQLVAQDAARYAANADAMNAAAAERRRLNRLRAIEVQGGVCVECGTTDDLILDHIEGGGSLHRQVEHDNSYCARIARTGVPDPRLQVLCQPCHKPKTAREVAAYWQHRMAERKATA